MNRISNIKHSEKQFKHQKSIVLPIHQRFLAAGVDFLQGKKYRRGYYTVIYSFKESSDLLGDAVPRI